MTRGLFCRIRMPTPIATPVRAASRFAPSSASQPRRAAAGTCNTTRRFLSLPSAAPSPRWTLQLKSSEHGNRDAMPHLIVLYSANLESETDMSALCRRLADAMLTMQDEQRQQVFPTGGVRVFAYPASHYAVADGQRDYAFVYLNLRMGRGRTAAIKQRAGETLLAAAKAHFEPLFATRYIDRKSTRLNSSHLGTSYAVFCLKKKTLT